jgi:hypothetical protein
MTRLDSEALESNQLLGEWSFWAISDLTGKPWCGQDIRGHAHGLRLPFSAQRCSSCRRAEKYLRRNEEGIEFG